MKKPLLNSLVGLILILCCSSSPHFNLKDSAEKPQVITLERFRKALWKVYVTINGKPGDFLLDTGGGITLLTDDYSSSIDPGFWGRTTGYKMSGTKFDGPHWDSVRIYAGWESWSTLHEPVYHHPRPG